MVTAAPCRGRVASTVQPRPGTARPGRCRRAAWLARPSRSGRSPDPGRSGKGSDRRRRRRAAARTTASPSTRTSTSVAFRAWRRALVTASWAIRNTAASTAAGRPVEVTCELHLHPWRRRRRTDEPLEVGDSRLGRVVGGRPAAQHAHHGAHLGERARRLHLDHLQGLERRARAGRRKGSPCLGLDGDRRHVVGHRVVQLPSQLDALLGLHLLEPPVPGAVLGAHRLAEDDGAQQHGGPTDRVPDTGPADVDAERSGQQDDHQSRRPPRARTPTGTGRTGAPGSRSSCTSGAPGRSRRSTRCRRGRTRRTRRRPPRTDGYAARAAWATGPPSPAPTATAAAGPREAWPPARRRPRRRPAAPSRATPAPAPRAARGSSSTDRSGLLTTSA